MNCNALDDRAKRCKKKGTVKEHYHGDNECYPIASGRPQWVTVLFCEDHADKPRKSRRAR